MANRTAPRILPALLLLATTGCGVLAPSADETAAIPPPPPVVEGVPDPIPPAPADGLHRFVVRPPVPVVANQGDASSEGAGGSVSNSPSSSVGDPATDPATTPATTPTTIVSPSLDPVWTIDLDLVDQIDEHTIVVFQDGIPGFVGDGGEFVALVGNSSASTGPPVLRRSPSTETDVIDELIAIEGVVSAVAIGDGSFAVVAEQADTLDGQGFESIVDTPVALAADPYEHYQWTLDNTGDNLNGVSGAPAQTTDADIDGVEAKAGARGAGVVVAVIDTGVDFSHPDLAGQRWVNDDENCTNRLDDDGNGYVDDCHGWDFGYEDNTPFNQGTLEHGTHVAGTIAATADNGVGVVGMAPEATIMDLNVQGPGGMTMSGIARAVRYAADNGADIVNMSLGTQPGTPAQAVQSLIDAVAYAETRGTLVVVAAGNSSVNLDASAVYPANIEGPNMITVGASAPDETRASFSNYGSPVDLFAPGVLIVSTVPGGGYKFMNGTSMASPTAAGAAAAVLSANPSLDPQGIREQLVGTGDTFAAYQGKAANPVRINQAWALGIDGDPAEVQVAIQGLTSASTDGVVADITISDPEGLYPQPYHWEGSLVSLVGGQVYGLVDHPVSVDWQSASTDERGSVALASGGADRARLETQLPPGTYGLVIEAVPDGEETVRLGEAFVSTFVVPDDAPTTTTTAPTTSTSAPGQTTSTTSSSGGGGPTTNPPTTAPPTTGPTTGPTAPTTGPTTGPTPAPTAPRFTTSTAPATTTPAPSPSTTARATTTTNRLTTSTVGAISTTAKAPTTTAKAPTTTATAPSPTTSPSITANPSTTAGSITTTNPPTTSAPTSPPTTTVSGDFAVYQINPPSGHVGQQTMVSITGKFPSQVYAWFGNQVAETVVHTSTWLVVVAPPSGEAGPVDLTLRSAGLGTVLTIPDGFTYLATGGGGGGGGATTTTTAPTTSTTSSSGGGGGPTTTTSPGNGGGGGGGGAITSTTTSSGGGGGGGGGASTSTTTSSGGGGGGGGGATTSSTTSSGGGGGGGGSSTSTTAGVSTTQGTTTTTTPPGPQRQARSVTQGGPISLGGGLTGVPLQGLGGLAEVPRCISEPCRPRRV